MDNSFEQCVRKPDYTQEEKMFKLYTILMCLSIFAVVAGIVLLFSVDYLLGALVIIMWGIVAICFYKLRDNAIIEYDYEFIDNIILISKVSHSSKRKTIVAIPAEQLKSIYPLNTNPNYDQNKKSVVLDGATLPLINCSLNEDARRYLLRGTSNNKDIVVIWEPKQDMLKLIRSERKDVVSL